MKDKTKELKKEIKFLTGDTAYDIDNDHRRDRLRILKDKKGELKKLLLV